MVVTETERMYRTLVRKDSIRVVESYIYVDWLFLCFDIIWRENGFENGIT